MNPRQHKRRPVLSWLQLSFLLLGVTLPGLALSQPDSTDDGVQDFRAFWHRKPAVSVFYGVTHTSWNALNFSIPNPGIAELRLGAILKDYRDEDPHTLRGRFDYLSFMNISSRLGTRALPGDANIDLWRLGMAREKRYGYELGSPSGEQAFILYHGSGAGWSRLTVKDNIDIPADSAQLALYEGRFRFGTNMEAGMNLRLLPGFEITLAYERDIVFRRHQVGKWLGSVLTEEAGQWLVDRIVHHIVKSSPRAGPLAAFLLENGLSFALYQLRHEQMFFPFSSESPLANDSFKVGMTILF